MERSPSLRNPETLLAAVRAFGARDWSQAEVLCRQALAEDASNPDALHILGLALAEMGRKAEGVRQLKEATARQPANPSLWLNLGKLCCDAGQFAEAVECQHKAIGLKQDNPGAWFNP